MFLEFTQIENPHVEPHEDRVAPNGMKIHSHNNHDKYSFWAQFFYCQCGHIYYNHNIETGKCDAEYFGKCDCVELIFCEAQMEIVFTTADLFEVENPDYSERDSPQWWNEFIIWLEKTNGSK